MGVDYYSCNHCGDTFPDCGYYIHCNDDCYKMWCSDECAEKDGYLDDPDKAEDHYYSNRSCKYCRNEDVDDTELLNFMFKYFGTTREDAVKLYFKQEN